jgi:hypothetical protein
VRRYEIAEFGREAVAANIRYRGVCCGAGPQHIRALAEALGRRPPAGRFSANMSKHFASEPIRASSETIENSQKEPLTGATGLGKLNGWFSGRPECARSGCSRMARRTRQIDSIVSIPIPSRDELNALTSSTAVAVTRRSA